MRTIKFRGWDGEKMIEDWLIFTNTELGIFPRTVSKNVIKLLQFTGLLDKNGKEIYEGYILQGYGTHPLEVVHGKYGWDVKFKDGGVTYTEPINNNLFVDYEPEIIGNIYENPELLK